MSLKSLEISLCAKLAVFWLSRYIIICCDDQLQSSLMVAWSKKACPCSSKSSPSRPIKSKNGFKRLGYCVLVLGLLEKIKAYETGLLAIVLLVE